MTVTINGAGGITGFGGVGPAFSAYQSAAQSIPNSTLQKLTMDAVEYDTAGNFANSRFTPSVAGYYLCTGNFAVGGITSTSIAYCSITKNGSEFRRGTQIPGTTLCTVSALVYLNGSTDYVEIAGFQNTGAAQNSLCVGTGTSTYYAGLYAYFQATLVRAAAVLPNYSVPVSPSNGPAFHAYQSVTNSIPNNTLTKVNLNVKEFDTAGYFDNVTNYRFQPAVAGYYQFDGCVGLSGSYTMWASFLKNGTEIRRGQQGVAQLATCSGLIYLNGSSDYVELATYQSSGGSLNTITEGVKYTFLSGFLARLP